MERPAATCADPPREKGRTKKERSPRGNPKCFRTKVHRWPRETKDRRPETTRSDTKDRSHRGRASFRGRSIALEAQNHSRTLHFRSIMDPKTSPKTLRRAPGALPGAPGTPVAPPGTPTSSKVDACAAFRASGVTCWYTCPPLCSPPAPSPLYTPTDPVNVYSLPQENRPARRARGSADSRGLRPRAPTPGERSRRKLNLFGPRCCVFVRLGPRKARCPHSEESAGGQALAAMKNYTPRRPPGCSQEILSAA